MVRFLILTGEKRKFLTRISCLSGLKINFLVRKTSILLGWMQPVYFAFSNNNSPFSISVDSNGSEITSDKQLSDQEYNSSHEGSDEEISDDETTHTLAFKCIGAAHEKERQEFLKIASQKSKETKLQVKLRPEPTNEKDKNAIAIDINHGSGFFHCGYIASELTQYLHPLIDTDKIVDVSLEHIQFRVSFSRMGYYPKVLITRKGAWEKFVIYRCRSTI